ncbi:hypothetical protein ACHWQZ_G010295 [Mnemiopsis leidyi]
MQERLRNFKQTVEVVNDVNDDKTLPYTSCLNFVSVMTDQEVRDLLTLDRVNISRWEKEQEPSSYSFLKQPKVVNWVERGAVPAVKNQGSCGSCWAFSATSAMEGNYFIETGDQVSFSDQESLECSVEGLDKKWNGCSGGWMGWPYDYVKKVDRLALEKDFKYVASDRPCNMAGVPNGLKKARLTGHRQLPKSDKDLLQAAAVSVVSVGIQVSNTPFSTYRSGVYTCQREKGCNCQQGGDHAINLVGYGEGYWRLKNSWGSSWGDQGYIKMSRNQDNICLINTAATVPVFQCRPGQKCKKWDGNDDDKEEEEEEDFDVGKPVKCGEIKHFGGRCVDLSNSGNEAVLTDIGCDREFCLTDKGYLKDKVTDKCLTTSDPDRNDNLITFGICKTARMWAETKKGFKIQPGSGKCWHPLGGSANPPNENKIVIYSGCDEDRLTFRMEASMCWEEQSGKKLSKKVGGKLKKLRKLDVAKDMCVETVGCTGIYFTKGKYFLSSSDKPQSSKKKGDKVFVMTDCSEACQAGEQRCEDGKCREKCEKNDDDCPPGTTRCPDGVCKHVHMC